MNILLVNISLRPESIKKFFPISLGYISTAMKNAGFAFDLLDIDGYRYSDEEIETKISAKRYDIVCMGCIVTGYKFVKSLANVVKKYHPNAIVIAGNSVATSIPDIILNKTQVDITVMGEGDETIVDLLHTIHENRPLDEVLGICFVREGNVIHNPPRPVIKDVSTVPFIDFSIFDIEIYIENSRICADDPLPIPREEIRALPVNTARGCVANCSFCYHVFQNVPYRYRSAEAIVAEIKHMVDTYSLNYIQFWDELTFFSKKQALEFAEKVLEEKVHFYWKGTCRGNLFDEEQDVLIIEKMKQAGCLAMGYSLESSDPEILKAMNKHVSVAQFSRQTELLRKAGLATYTSLVFGYPQETPETIRKTFDCCIENKIYPSSGYLLPQPGSVMYDYAIEKGLIKGDPESYLLAMGDRQDLRVNMTQMSDDEFENHVVAGLKRTNEALKIGLKDEELIRTTYYRAYKDN
ncbi:B12-binding domain-containing radical SAM protein [Pelosinus sp. sgz500959]|uniref:B12-binding domain-containing radical SAM protein n=1 Tax=Pelosinus sp. sgz500959 TaxID=3242472 RepID=UPI00366D3FCD